MAGIGDMGYLPEGSRDDSAGSYGVPVDQGQQPTLGQSLWNIAKSPFTLAYNAVAGPVAGAFHLFGTPSQPGHLWEGPQGQGNAQAFADVAVPFFGGEALGGLGGLSRDALASGPLASSAPEAISARVYRGSDDPQFITPNPNYRAGRSSGAFWASSSPEVADTYAGLQPGGGHWLNDPSVDPSEFDRHNYGGQTVMPADINFNNPMVVDAHGAPWGNIPIGETRNASTDVLARLARMRGHDGLVVNNVRDHGGEDMALMPPTTTYAALRPGTVRSPLTGETLFSDTGKPSLMGSALAGAENPIGSMPPGLLEHVPPTSDLFPAEGVARMDDLYASLYPSFHDGSWRRGNGEVPSTNDLASASGALTPYDASQLEQAWRDKIKRTGELFSDTGKPSLGAALAGSNPNQQYASGGQVGKDSMADTSGLGGLDPAIMGSAIDTMPETPAPAPTGLAGIQDRQRAASMNARETGLGPFLSGILGMGGATGAAAKAAGHPEVSDWLESNAAKSPQATTWGEVANLPGSIAGAVYKTGKGLYDAYNAQTPAQPDQHVMSRDEYMAAHAPPSAMSLTDYVAKAKNDFMPQYQSLVKDGYVKRANEMLSQTAKDAADSYNAEQKALTQKRGQVDDDYDKYLIDQNARLFAQHSQSFADRHPMIAAAAPGLGALASYMMARGLFGKLADKGEEFLTAGNEAQTANNAGKWATNAADAKDWAGGLGWKKAGALGFSAALPFEARTFADVTDKYGLPREYIDANGQVQRSHAQQSAEDRMNDPYHYIASGIPAMLTGLTGASLGAHSAAEIPNVANLAKLPSAADMQAFNDYKKANVLGQRQLNGLDVLPPLSPKEAKAQLLPATPLRATTNEQGALPPPESSPASGGQSGPAKPSSKPRKDKPGSSEAAESKALASSLSPASTPPPPVDPATKAAASDQLRRFLGNSQPDVPPMFASGGAVHGPLHSDVPGRTDHLPRTVRAGSYVLPADFISALGEGNTNAGMKITDHMFPEEPPSLHYAAGGDVDIMAAGGERILSPEQVARKGGGDLDHGHKVLDALVKRVRAHTIKTLQKLPPPAK